MASPPERHDLYDIIREGSEILGVAVSAASCSKLVRYTDLLLQWNRRLNLTSVRDPAQICVLHILDSLTVFKVLSHISGLKILDIGSGGGFPGMVIKIADESLRMTLLDKNPKKIVFLKHVTKELGLLEVAFLNIRFETLLAQESPLFFDVVVSRAVSYTSEFFDSLRRLLSPGGSVIRMAGPSTRGLPEEISRYAVAETWAGRLPFSTRIRYVYRYSLVP